MYDKIGYFYYMEGDIELAKYFHKKLGKQSRWSQGYFSRKRPVFELDSSLKANKSATKKASGSQSAHRDYLLDSREQELAAGHLISAILKASIKPPMFLSISIDWFVGSTH